MGVVRHYYNFLKYTGQTCGEHGRRTIKNNPAAGLYIRGRQRTIPHDLLTADQLEEMYNGFKQRGIAGKRNKIMLGLLIYQGLNTNELEQLEPGHLKLKEGKTEVPGTRRSNRRILKLEAHQMLDLQEYVSKTRVYILEIAEKQSEKLFVSSGGSDTLHGCIDKLVRQLQKQCDYFVNA
jgi:integrase/recombinase XerD